MVHVTNSGASGHIDGSYIEQLITPFLGMRSVGPQDAILTASFSGLYHHPGFDPFTGMQKWMAFGEVISRPFLAVFFSKWKNILLIRLKFICPPEVFCTQLH